MRMENSMIVTTTDFIPGKNVTFILGAVNGSTVRTTSTKDDLVTNIKGIFGAELSTVTKLLEEARVEATSRMISEAKKLGADAIIGLKYETTPNIFGALEVFIFGTAVRLN